MTDRARGAPAAASLLAPAPVLLWGLHGLPSFFEFHGAYSHYLLEHALAQRHASNLVMAVTFDYRGFDTLGEETILFAAVMGVALLFREAREHGPSPEGLQEQDGVRIFGLLLLPPLVALGLWVVGHGQVTPGGGFQGGVLLASVAVLLWLAGGYAVYRFATPAALIDGAESFGLAAFVVVGLAAMATGHAFLYNLLPYGRLGHLDSGGTIAVLNALVGLVVAGGFVLLYSEFLQEVVVGEEEQRE
jgi:multicomponent Na+:H+ antiporter subunit B